jgi:hypothetical protein
MIPLKEICGRSPTPVKKKQEYLSMQGEGISNRIKVAN